MMTNQDDIKAICKRCKRAAPASSFILDPVYKIVVCPDCVKERTRGKPKTPNATSADTIAKQPTMNSMAKPFTNMQRGSEEPVELKLSAEQPEQPKPIRLAKAADASKVRYTCGKCKYKFTYSIEKKYPNTCPNCNSPVFFLGGND